MLLRWRAPESSKIWRSIAILLAPEFDGFVGFDGLMRPLNLESFVGFDGLMRPLNLEDLVFLVIEDLVCLRLFPYFFERLLP